MIRIQIPGQFYIWKLVNRIRRSIISTGTSAKTKAALSVSTPNKKKTNSALRSFLPNSYTDGKWLGPNKSLLLWFYQSDTGTSSLHRYTHSKLLIVNYCEDFVNAEIWFCRNEISVKNMMPKMCPQNYENSENVEMNPFCGFDAKRWYRIVRNTFQKKGFTWSLNRINLYSLLPIKRKS